MVGQPPSGGGKETPVMILMRGGVGTREEEARVFVSKPQEPWMPREGETVRLVLTRMRSERHGARVEVLPETAFWAGRLADGTKPLEMCWVWPPGTLWEAASKAYAAMMAHAKEARGGR
jgi:hypothetical protein